MNVRSRILEFLPKDLIIELNSICKDVLIPDNNTKVDRMVAALDKYDVDYSELGPGTNRFAILIDGYVFKIAMDKAGIRDNLAEFSLSQELQPFVIKVYECNGLIIVTEYVTVISKEEFLNSKDDIRQVLSYLAQGYLLGDVGTIVKNFMNWGYRDDNSLVILDFAYIYRVLGEEMMCAGMNSDGSTCETILEYDQDFNNLICPKCRKKYTFHDIRRKISKEYENKELETIKQIAVKVTKPIQEIGKDTVIKNKTQDSNTNNGGTTTMSKHRNNYNEEFDNVSLNDLYLDAMSFMRETENTEPVSDTEDDCVSENSGVFYSDAEETVENVEDTTDTFYDVDSEDDDDDESVYFRSESEEYYEESENDGEEVLYGKDVISMEDSTSDNDRTTSVEYKATTVESFERVSHVTGLKVFEAGETITEESFSMNSTDPYVESTDSADALRKELAEDLNNDMIIIGGENNTDDSYDEYEKMYDEIDDEKLERKYHSKKRNLE